MTINLLAAAFGVCAVLGVCVVAVLVWLAGDSL